MVPGDMNEWSRVIFVKKSKFLDAGGPDTVVSPYAKRALTMVSRYEIGTPMQNTKVITNVQLC